MACRLKMRQVNRAPFGGNSLSNKGSKHVKTQWLKIFKAQRTHQRLHTLLLKAGAAGAHGIILALIRR